MPYLLTGGLASKSAPTWRLFKTLTASGLATHATPDNAAYGESGLGSNSGLYARVANSVVVGAGGIGLEPAGGAGLYPSLHQSPGVATMAGAVEIDAASFSDLSLGSGRYGVVQDNGRNLFGSNGLDGSYLASWVLSATNTARLRYDNLTVTPDLQFTGAFPEGVASPAQANVTGGTVVGSAITPSAGGKNGGVIPDGIPLTVRVEWGMSGLHRTLRVIVSDQGADSTVAGNNYWDLTIDLTAQYGLPQFNSGNCTFYCACDNSTNGSAGVFEAFRMYRDASPTLGLCDARVRLTGSGPINAGTVYVEREGYGLKYPQAPTVSTATGSGGVVRSYVYDMRLRGLSVEAGGGSYAAGDYVTVPAEASAAPETLLATIPELLPTQSGIRINWPANPTGVWPLTYTLTRMSAANTDENDTTGGTVLATVNPLSRADWLSVVRWIGHDPGDNNSYMYHLKTVDSSGSPVARSAYRNARRLGAAATASVPNPLHVFQVGDSISVSLEGIAAWLGGSSLTGDSTGQEFYGADPAYSLLWLDNALSYTARWLRDRMNVEVHIHNVAVSGSTLAEFTPAPPSELAYYSTYTSGPLRGTAIPAPGRNYKELSNRISGTTWAGFDPSTDPFVIHIASGMNDLRSGSASAALASLQTLLTALKTDFPRATVIVSEVSYSADHLAFPNIPTYNAGRAGVVAAAGGGRIKAGTGNAYDRTAYAYPDGFIRYPYGTAGSAAVADRIHPGITGGYRELGYAWAEDIHEALASPSPSGGRGRRRHARYVGV